jgi:hypothetical protein
MAQRRLAVPPHSASIVAALIVASLCASTPAVAFAQRLPLGDGHVANHPTVGYVYSCRTAFRAGAAAHEVQDLCDGHAPR